MRCNFDSQHEVHYIKAGRKVKEIKNPPEGGFFQRNQEESLAILRPISFELVQEMVRVVLAPRPKARPPARAIMAMNPVTIVWMICVAMFNCASAVKNPNTAIAQYVTMPRNGPAWSFAPHHRRRHELAQEMREHERREHNEHRRDHIRQIIEHRPEERRKRIQLKTVPQSPRGTR